MFGQTFQASDLAAILALVALESLLSGDNALVLAIMVRHLPKEEQKRALFYGLAGAFVFRLIAIVFAAFVLRQWWLQGLGAIYLLAVPIKHFVKSARQKGRPPTKPKGASFWMTVLAVEVTDIAFAVDSVLAGVTFVDNRTEKIWVVYLGAVIGIVLLRVAAGQFIRLLEKYPLLDHVAYLLVAWVGVKLLFLTGHSFQAMYPKAVAFHIPEMPPILFWACLLAIGGIGSALALRTGTPDAPSGP
jgi:YkoY family integral membrane protein